MEDGNNSQDTTVAAEAPWSARVLAWADRHRWWLFAGVVVLYALGFTGRWRVAPDTALYMELGRNLSEGKGFVYHGVKHNWYEPGLPYVIGLSFRWFGEDNYVPLALFMVACGFVSLALVYHLFRVHAGRPTAVVMTVLLAAAETFYRYCFQIVTDTPFLVGIMGFLLGYEALVRREDAEARERPRRWGPWGGWALIAAGTVVMCAFRPTIITFLGALAVATLYHLVRGPDRVRHVLIAALAVGSVLAFRAADPRRSTPGEAAHREATLKTLLTEKRGWALERSFKRFIPEMLSEHTPEAVMGIEVGTPQDQILSVATIALGLGLVTRRVLWGAWVAATVAQMAFWLPRERYFLPILPLLQFAVWRAALWLEVRTPEPGERTPSTVQGRLGFIAIASLLLVPNLVQDANFIYEQHWLSRGVSLTDRRDPTGSALMEMGELIRTNVGEEDAVLAEPARQLTYFSRRKVVAPPTSLRQPPSEKMLQRVRADLLSARQLYAVMPETWDIPHVKNLMDELGMELGPEVGRVAQGPWKDRPQPTLVLHRLVPKGTGQSSPATRPAGTSPATVPRGRSASPPSE